MSSRPGAASVRGGSARASSRPKTGRARRRRDQLPGRARRHARHRRRVGLGQDACSLTMIGLTRHMGARISGRILFEGRDLLGLPERELRACAATRSRWSSRTRCRACTAVHRGQPDRRGACARTAKVRGARRASARSSCCGSSASRGAPARGRLPARVLRRDAPARDDRDGARQRAQAADRRRADDARWT